MAAAAAGPMQSILTDASFVLYLDKNVGNAIGATCISSQSKAKENDRCKNRRKAGSCFCGIHLNVDESRVVNEAKECYITFLKSSKEEAYPEKDMAWASSSKANTKDMEMIKEIPTTVFDGYARPGQGGMEIESPTTTDIETMIRRAIREKNPGDLSVTVLRNYIKDPSRGDGLSKKIHPDQSREKLLEALAAHFALIDHYDAPSNKSRLIKAQATIRRWLIRRRAKCANKTDIITMDTIYEIPGKYFYIFHDKKGKNWYGYDIRVFTRILYDPLNPKHVPKCPYTHRELEHDDIIMVEAYIEKMRKRGVSFEIERPRMSKEKEIELKCIDIFSKMDHLDNYTNHRWFMDLSQAQLIKFYNIGRDIWGYRLNMSSAAKLNILSDGRAFEIKDDYLKSLPSKVALQNMVLNEVNRFVTEGKNREEKKLGAMLMLTALVEVSSAAAQAMPHLVQVF